MARDESSGAGQGISRRQALGWTARGGAALAGAAMLGAQPSNGCCFVVIAPEYFRPPAEFFDDVRRLVETLRATPTREGFDAVLAHGDPEALAEAEHTSNGIPLDDVTWQTIVDAGRSVGVEYEP